MKETAKNKNRVLLAKQFGVRFLEFFTAYVDSQMSKADYARSIGVSSAALTNWFNGTSIPSGDVFLKMIRVHPDVNWYYIVFGEGSLSDSFITMIPNAMEILKKNIGNVKADYEALLKEYENVKEKYELAKKLIEKS